MKILYARFPPVAFLWYVWASCCWLIGSFSSTCGCWWVRTVCREPEYVRNGGLSLCEGNRDVLFCWTSQLIAYARFFRLWYFFNALVAICAGMPVIFVARGKHVAVLKFFWATREWSLACLLRRAPRTIVRPTAAAWSFHMLSSFSIEGWNLLVLA